MKIWTNNTNEFHNKNVFFYIILIKNINQPYEFDHILNIWKSLNFCWGRCLFFVYCPSKLIKFLDISLKYNDRYTYKDYLSNTPTWEDILHHEISVSRVFYPLILVKNCQDDSEKNTSLNKQRISLILYIICKLLSLSFFFIKMVWDIKNYNKYHMLITVKKFLVFQF